LIHESHAGIPVTANAVRQLHQRLFAYHPSGGGEWKSTDNDIVERDKAGNIVRVRFRPVAAHLTVDAMWQTEQLYAEAMHRAVEPFVLSGLVVLDFLCIHPFRDGNGRMARLLTLLLLYHAGHRVGRYISLERVVEESKDAYYESLERSSLGWHEASHDALPWLRYYWGVLTRAYRELEERVGQVTGKGSKSERVIAAVERRIGPFRITDIERECPDVSRELIRLVLRDQRNKGALRTEGMGRGARWVKTAP
jgi:Fic family protein